MAVKYLIISLLLSFQILNPIYAGFNSLTWHSRANCGNNESITWDWTTYRMTGTVSQHYKGGTWIHGISSGWENTWRSAAVHWGEAGPTSGWEVMGYHWLMQNNQQKLIAQTDVKDCSIYDGWWDRKKK